MIVWASSVLAIDPELEIGKADYRSWLWNANRRYDDRYRDLFAAIALLGDGLTLLQSAIDPIEARWRRLASERGIAAIPINAAHGGAVGMIDWQNYFNSGLDPVLLTFEQDRATKPYLEALESLHDRSVAGRYGEALRIADGLDRRK